MAGTDPFTLFFTGQDDPRDHILIGEIGNAPVFFRFETPGALLGPATRTTIHRNNDELAAWLDWTLGSHLGTCNVLGQEMNMSQFVEKGSKLNARRFVSRKDNQPYEWRKCTDDTFGYDLVQVSSGVRLAEYRRTALNTAVGPSHAIIHVWFISGTLLLEALIALALNRWIDWHGF